MPEAPIQVQVLEEIKRRMEDTIVKGDEHFSISQVIHQR